MYNSQLNPLVVDLDGTLIKSDLLVESCLLFVCSDPLAIFKIFKWFLAGKANLKEKLATVSDIDVNVLPYNQKVIEFIKKEKQKGRKIVLATASHLIYAQRIASHLDIFDQVFATEGKLNLSKHNKCNKLVTEFGDKGFDYIGNSNDDLVVWKKSQAAIVVDPEVGVLKKAKSLGNVQKIIHSSQNIFKTWAKALRLHQWIKNSLIFVPLLASHQFNQIDLVFNGLLAFICFGLCASHVYLFNDLIDLTDDRHHPTKRYRPFAAGLLSIKAGLLMCAILLISAFVGSILLLPQQFTLALIIYYVLTVSYSIGLKRLMMLDIITLAILYTMRIIAGTYAFGVDLTFWMLAFSMFIFLSLSLVKRYAELYELRGKGEAKITRGRGYYPADLEMISSLGASSGYLSVMVLALYIQDKNTIILYQHPHIMWLACPLFLYWISRVWLLAHRGLMHEDPIVFAIKDRTSWLIGGLLMIVFGLAI